MENTINNLYEIIILYIIIIDFNNYTRLDSFVCFPRLDHQILTTVRTFSTSYFRSLHKRRVTASPFTIHDFESLILRLLATPFACTLITTNSLNWRELTELREDCEFRYLSGDTGK